MLRKISQEFMNTYDKHKVLPAILWGVSVLSIVGGAKFLLDGEAYGMTLILGGLAKGGMAYLVPYLGEETSQCPIEKEVEPYVVEDEETGLFLEWRPAEKQAVKNEQTMTL